MGKYNDLLIEFMTEKNRIVKHATGLLIATKRDLDELRSWPEGLCKRALSKLSDTSDGKCCPWCLIYPCNQCNYAERNSRCGGLDITSRYRKITNRLFVRIGYLGIMSIPEMKKLIETIKRKFQSMTGGDNTVTKNNNKPPKNV